MCNGRRFASLGVETLEAREMPAFVASFRHGELRVAFDNNVATGQSVQMSAVNGYVTLNEVRINVRTADVRAITIVGSDRDNFIDLKFVSTQTRFKGLDGHVSILGKGGNDVLMGTQFGDRIDGGNGSDQIWGNAGRDTLFGGAGNDSIYGGFGNDALNGGPGIDWFDRLEPGDRLVQH